MTHVRPDLDALVQDCADEPIRIPGSVQPHGVLLAAHAATLAVVVASESARAHLGRAPEELLGTRLPDLFGQSWPTDGLHSLDASEPHRLQVVVGGVRRTFDALAHETDGLVVVELEPPAPEPEEVAVRARASLRALQDAGTGLALTDTIAREVRALTGFDRVMVYRFDQHWHGTVVAEDARPDLGLDPYLGLRFPASDIPAQARELYTTQWLRSIPDATYTPSPLVPSFHPETGAPLDLSASALRSVSPVHLQYLRNMGVAASMSVSLLTHGRLWGLVACHHYSGPHYPTQAERGAAEFLGRTASVLLEGDEHRRRYLGSLGVGATAGNLATLVTTHDREPLTALTRDHLLLALVDGATGAMVRLNGRTVLLGETPEPADVQALVARLWPTGHRAPVVTASVRTFLDVDGRPPHGTGGTGAGTGTAADADAALAERLAPTASGVLALPVQSGTGGDALVWFKPEVLAEVRWAGDPAETGLEATPAGLRLTPRASFATYVERVRGSSTPFDPVEVEAAERLATTTGDVLVRRAAEDARLAAALQQLMLTTRPPVPDGYAVSSRYRPSGSDAVGGDWFDATSMPDGRLVLMVGDVAGHGMGMAAVTAQLRHALRAYLIDAGGAAGALERLGGLIAELLPGELATVTAVELEPATGRATVVSAGHPPPVLRTADGAALLDQARGPALGLGVDPTHDVHTVELEAGDAVVLYTDGLVEQRHRPLSHSLRDLRDQVTVAPEDPEGLCDALLAGAPLTDDDVTLVALHRLS